MVNRPHLHNRPPLNRYSLTVSQSSALLSVHEQGAVYASDRRGLGDYDYDYD